MALRSTAFLLLLAASSAACEDPREHESRQAVKQLVKATPSRVRAARERVARIGRFALVDIEQELHGADLATRLRLIATIREIGDPEALPLLRFLERWDDEQLAREAAREARLALEAAASKGRGSKSS